MKVCDSGSKILPNDIQTKIFFISINYAYFKFRATSLLISVNMIYTNEENVRYDAKWLYTAPWVTPFCHFVLTLKLLSCDRSQIWRDANNGLLYTHKIPIHWQSNYEYIESCGKF